MNEWTIKKQAKYVFSFWGRIFRFGDDYISLVFRRQMIATPSFFWRSLKPTTCSLARILKLPLTSQRSIMHGLSITDSKLSHRAGRITQGRQIFVLGRYAYLWAISPWNSWTRNSTAAALLYDMVIRVSARTNETREASFLFQRLSLDTLYTSTL